MKRNKYKIITLIGIIAFSMVGCNDYLNREDISGIITPDLVWTNPKAIEAVLVNMYDAGIKHEDFDYWDYGSKSDLRNPTTMSDEAQGSYQKNPLFSNADAVYTYNDWILNDPLSTRYVYIRNTNDFIEKVAESDVLNDAQKEQLDAEARWIRAYQYFGLVKRYGGVPLLTEPQQYNPADPSSMYAARNTEAEIYDFIINECNAIKDILPQTRPDVSKYRVTKGAALALCSRAGLYAGTIAKYSKTLSLSGTAVARGYVCIPETEAERFFKSSHDASYELLHDMSNYSLPRSTANTTEARVDNFYHIFSATTNGNSGEYILQKQYNVAGGRGHMWDKMNIPFSYRQGGWGCGVSPVLEMIEAFEYIDGTPGELRIANGATPIQYDNLLDLFKDKDPRLFATVYVPGYPLRGSVMEWRRGVIDQNGTKYVASKQPSDEVAVTLPGYSGILSGKDGGADAGDASKTGFYQRKFMDETLDDLANIDDRKSSTPFVMFRLGEIYLNYAEACLEMSSPKTSEALWAVNEIRDRAGIRKITQDELTIEKVRHERKVELAFENHRYWDMKRWRIAHLPVAQGGLTGFRGKALYPWLDVRTGKYVFEIGEKPPKQTRLFLERNYYNRFGTEDVTPNPLLIQNPGYAY